MKALVTGITGQDGSYMAELLLAKGYKVSGLIRRSSTPNTKNIQHILEDIELFYGDLTDQGCINKIVQEFKPDEIYNLGAQSFVPVSWKAPIYTAETDALGPLRLLEAIRLYSPYTKFFQASTSEMFGKVQAIPQVETTPFYPRSPYGVSKLFGHWITINYRESYDLFASIAITYNHDSEKRGEEFVTRKITKAVARIKLGLQKELALGNLSAKRDFGYAPDYVNAFYKIMQHTEPDTFIVGSGETHTIEEFCDLSFKEVGLNYLDYIVIDPKFYRPAEVDILLSNPEKIKKVLGWESGVKFPELVSIMVAHDLKEESERL
jgi:GDPmannose 4,6-dehydratase